MNGCNCGRYVAGRQIPCLQHNQESDALLVLSTQSAFVAVELLHKHFFLATFRVGRDGEPLFECQDCEATSDTYGRDDD